MIYDHLTILSSLHSFNPVFISFTPSITSHSTISPHTGTLTGHGILVSSKIKETAATFTVRSPVEVGQLLQSLVEWSSTADNGWHTRGDKSLWRVGALAAAPPAAVVLAAPKPLDPQQQKWQAWQNQVAQGQQGASSGLGP